MILSIFCTVMLNDTKYMKHTELDDTKYMKHIESMILSIRLMSI